jgi:hypothetical protein
MRSTPFLSKYFLVPSLFTAAVTLFASTASAADPVPPNATSKEAPDETNPEAHLRGLEVMLRPTLGSAGGESPIIASPDSSKVPGALRTGSGAYGAALGAGAQLGVRFHPIISAGLRADIGTVSATAPSDGTQNLSRGWQTAGLYARAYPLAMNESLRRFIDPWIATGIVYAHDSQTFDRQEGSTRKVDATWRADTHGIGIPVGVGMDFRMTKWLSGGPSFEYLFMNPLGGCVTATPAGGKEEKVCTSDGDNGLKTQTLSAWNFGLTLRATPF